MKFLFKVSLIFSFWGMSLLAQEFTSAEQCWQKVNELDNIAKEQVQKGNYQDALISYFSVLELLDMMVIRWANWNVEQIQTLRFKNLEQAHLLMKEQLTMEEHFCHQLWIKSLEARDEADLKAEKQAWQEAETFRLKELEQLELIIGRSPQWKQKLIVYQKEECLRNLKILDELIKKEQKKSLIESETMTKEKALERIFQLEEIIRLQNNEVNSLKISGKIFEEVLDKVQFFQNKNNIEIREEVNALSKQIAVLITQKEDLEQKIAWWQNKYNQFIDSQLNLPRNVTSLEYELAVAKSIIAEQEKTKQILMQRLNLQAQLISTPQTTHGLAFEYWQQLEKLKKEKEILSQELEVLSRSRPIKIKDADLIFENEHLQKQNQQILEKMDFFQKKIDDFEKKNCQYIAEIQQLKEQLKKSKDTTSSQQAENEKNNE